jgi:hypothetical protein
MSVHGTHLLLPEQHTIQNEGALFTSCFEHEMESAPCKFELPSKLDVMHLAAFCRQITPLACLPVINGMANEFDQHDAAQHTVNRMNAFLPQQNISFGCSKKDKSIEQESRWILSTHR